MAMWGCGGGCVTWGARESVGEKRWIKCTDGAMYAHVMCHAMDRGADDGFVFANSKP